MPKPSAEEVAREAYSAWYKGPHDKPISANEYVAECAISWTDAYWNAHYAELLGAARAVIERRVEQDRREGETNWRPLDFLNALDALAAALRGLGE